MNQFMLSCDGIWSRTTPAKELVRLDVSVSVSAKPKCFTGLRDVTKAQIIQHLRYHVEPVDLPSDPVRLSEHMCKVERERKDQDLNSLIASYASYTRYPPRNIRFTCDSEFVRDVPLVTHL